MVHYTLRCLLKLSSFFQIRSGMTPCLDFYERSRVKLKPLEEEASQTQTPSQILAPSEKTDQFEPLNRAIQLGMSLIILWQVNICV